VPERILALSNALSSIAKQKAHEIQNVTKRTHMLALNAQIEAVRAGHHGAGFSIVAQEVKSVSQEVSEIVDDLMKRLDERTVALNDLGQKLVASVRGKRLTDLALNMIDIIDRNLYERSCDVRWWATDSAVVECATTGRTEDADFCSQRLAVILNSYTVYLDIWVADKEGKVLSNGRKSAYPKVQKSSVAYDSWFKEALRTTSGEEFVVADISQQGLLADKKVAVYAAAIRQNAKTDGEIIGVLGIFFDWEAQSQTVVNSVRLEEEEKSRTRSLILDRRHQVIAASDRQGILSEIFPLDTSNGERGMYVDHDGRTIGYALTPGYETYAGLGWYGVIVQSKDPKN
jgi:uncharacterized protein YukE